MASPKLKLMVFPSAFSKVKLGLAAINLFRLSLLISGVSCNGLTSSHVSRCSGALDLAIWRLAIWISIFSVSMLSGKG